MDTYEPEQTYAKGIVAPGKSPNGTAQPTVGTNYVDLEFTLRERGKPTCHGDAGKIASFRVQLPYDIFCSQSRKFVTISGLQHTVREDRWHNQITYVILNNSDG